MEPLTGIGIATCLVSVCTLVLSAIVYRMNRELSTFQVDHNIIAYITAIVTLLEQTRNLGPKERNLVKKLLEDYKFFEPSKVGDLDLSDKTEADKELEKYFNSI